MAFRKRRTTLSAGTPPPSHHLHPLSSSLKYILFVIAAALLLLVFAVSHRREAVASCRLCLLGEGAVREYRDGDGDGGVQHLSHADNLLEEDDSDEDDEGEGERNLAVSHVHICLRLFHEKQMTPVDLMHALNNLMQVNLFCSAFSRQCWDEQRSVWFSFAAYFLSGGKGRITLEEMDFIAEQHVSTDTSFNNRRDIDAVVIQAVAASLGQTVYFIDSVERLDRDIDFLDLREDRLFGFLLHLKGRLWIAVRHFQGLWYNFDSTKAAPLLFCEGAQSVHTFLHKVLDDGGLIVGFRKPRPANPIAVAEKPPPPSWTNVWKYRLFG